VKRLLEWTTEHFKKHDSESPRLDAEILLAQVLGCKRIDLYVSFAKDPGEDERTRFREMVKRRAAGEPVAYLVGYKEFYSLSFEVTCDTLIPRPETEHLVVESLDLLAKMGQRDDLSVCDIGTGNGAIAVAIAKNAPKCRVTAVDLSQRGT
jgi:release factor glutamine methyltransferase